MKTLAVMLALAPTVASAHPGHGHSEPESWTHYLTEPLHVGVLAGAVAAIAIARHVIRRKRARS